MSWFWSKCERREFLDTARTCYARGYAFDCIVTGEWGYWTWRVK